MDAHYCRSALEGDKADVVGKLFFTHCIKAAKGAVLCDCGASGAGLKGAFLSRAHTYPRPATRAQPRAPRRRRRRRRRPRARPR